MKGQQLLAVLILIACLLRSPKCNAETLPDVRAQAVLLRQFETVAYVHTDLLANYETRDLGQGDTNGAPNLSLALRLPFVPLVAGFRALGPGTVRTLEQSYPAFFVGAKDFRPPEGFGMFSSSDCYIGIAKRGTQPDIVSVFSQAKPDFVAGTRVWVWSIPPSEGFPKPTFYYAAQIAESFLLIANDQQIFSNAARELISSETLPIGIPGWKTFSSHDYWAYRPLSRTTAVGQLGRAASGARALTFFADIDKRESRVQMYVSDEITETMPNDLPASKVVQYRRVASGIWQATIPLVEGQVTTDALYQIFYYLGFGVVL